jgi:phosphohistidine phosphatase
MHLWIVRHADATPAPRAAGDFARALSPRGRADAERVAHWLKRGTHGVDAIVTSDAPRARATAKILASGFGLQSRRVRVNHLLYNASAATIVDVIREAPEAWQSFAVVGHNPGVSVVVRLLTDDAASRPLPTLGVARLDIDRAWSNVGAGSAALSLYLDPTTID